ncbi:hypothetical protein [Uliginosibacterium gangwonense]|uniref:hypothetical protein n=1 Tax=Uliginosibacterium gangwonense TaxID=392736 RepID=UPI000373C906|nr:hypothetical protein [Uliginosibacterium gangwonense]
MNKALLACCLPPLLMAAVPAKAESADPFTLKLEAEEAQYLNNIHCPEENCGEKRFQRHIASTYPDIPKLKIPKTKVMDSMGKEELQSFKNAFYRGAYLAKRIKLANGQSMFDFISQCTKGFSPTDQASYDDSRREWVQFYPTLRQAEDGKETSFDIRFYRDGEKLTNSGQILGQRMLTDPDFLKGEGLKCWKK